ncbi:hypothetical protein LCGC14_0609630 [marine sediment metagenome]|uniref:Uncharacterized protein n=1 Tax=marine sediment metagenome TaxID=412755 RepID=A0A0F9TUC7_9ZZZZ
MTKIHLERNVENLTSPTRGDLIYADSVPEFVKLTHPGADRILATDADDISWSTRLALADSATIPPLNITERSAEPSSPVSNDIYLDDGANTGSGSPGWRRYTGAAWEDIFAGAGSGFWSRDAGNGYVYPTTITDSVGIGTGLPDALLHIEADQNTTEYLHMSGYDDDAANVRPVMKFLRARGSAASPTIVSDDDYLGSILGVGYDGATFQNAASINFAVDGAPAAGDMPGRIEFYTAPDGSVNRLLRMTINNAGNVGIGNINPGSIFDIRDSVDGGMAEIRLINSDTNATPSSDESLGLTGYFYRNSVSGLREAGRIELGKEGTWATGATSDTYWAFHTLLNGGGVTERMRITGAGNVGIGTVPDTLLHLESASPSLTIQRSNNANSSYVDFQGSGGSVGVRIEYVPSINDIAFHTLDGTLQERVRILANGNVGIGIGDADRNLRVWASNSGASGYALTGGVDIESNSITGINILSPNTGYGRIYFGSPISATAGAIEYIHNATLTDGYMKLRAGGADRVYILGNGYVGIGTTPALGLHIADGIGFLVGGGTYVSPTNRNTINGGYDTDNDTGSLWLNYRGYLDGFTRYRDTNIADGKGNAIVTVDGSAGNVGIGTSAPQGIIHTYDSIGGSIVWEYDGVDGTERTIIPNGAGDCLYICRYTAVIRRSDGPTFTSIGSAVNNSVVALYSAGGNTLSMYVDTNGRIYVKRTAGALTYKVILHLIWL